MTRERSSSRWVSAVVIAVLTFGWLGGTCALLLTAYAQLFSIGRPPSVHSQLLADQLVGAAMICAFVLPLVAAMVCGVTGRGVGAVLFLVLGVLPALVVGITAGQGVRHDIHRLSPVKPVQPPSNYCPCVSGGSCDCPGG